MSTIRTFIAVDVAPEIRSAARREIRRLTDAGADYKWADPDKMHLTLKFLGNVRDTEVPDICRLVEQAVEDAEIIPVSVVGLGAFPSVDRPRILWMGIGEGRDELVDLQRRIDQPLQREFSFPPERQDFRPHLTLGRIARGARWTRDIQDLLNEYADYPFGGFEVDQVIVYSSFLDREGPNYTPMATIDLKG